MSGSPCQSMTSRGYARSRDDMPTARAAYKFLGYAVVRVVHMVVETRPHGLGEP